MADIKLIVGLCNPGDQYKDTRHNAGRWVMDALCASQNVSLKNTSNFFGEYGTVTINGNKVHLLCPNTFMNLSGKSVIAVLNFFKIKPEEMLVIHDELALEPGHAKFKFGGGHNGHNGLRDIHRVCGEKYWRLRVGIGHPGDKQKVVGHVLGKPPVAERKLHEESVEKCVRGIEDIYYYGLDKVMNTFNQ